MLVPRQGGNAVLLINFAANDKCYQPEQISLWRLHKKRRFLKHGSAFRYGVHSENFTLHF